MKYVLTSVLSLVMGIAIMIYTNSLIGYIPNYLIGVYFACKSVEV